MNSLKISNSKDIAKERVQNIVVSDRVQCTPELLELIKHDLLHTVSKYIKVDKEKFYVTILTGNSGGGNPATIYASIPIEEVISK